MKENENMDSILTQVHNVDKGINNMLIPILKDTINDGNKHNKRLFMLNICELFIILITIIVSIIFIYMQNIKYHEFLSQFDWNTEIVQDLDTGQGRRYYKFNNK